MIRRRGCRRWLSKAAWGCAVLLAVTGTAASAEEQRSTGAMGGAQPRAVAGSLLVTTVDQGATSTVRRFATTGTSTALAWATTKPITDHVTEVRVPAEQAVAAAHALASQPGVVAVEPNAIRHLLTVPDDLQYSRQWAHRLTGIESGWSVSTGSHNVTVAVIDSGVSANHPDLNERIIGQVDASTGQIRPGRTDNDSCRIGHGTWVSGVIGAIGDNRKGVAGTNWNVSILDVSITSPDTSCDEITDSAAIAGIDYAVTRGAKVINLSFGAAKAKDPSCPKALQATLDRARSAGALVVAAAGNDGSGVVQVPASCNGVMSVAAVGPKGSRAGYSTKNAFVDVAAPGGEGSRKRRSSVDVLTTSYWNFGVRTKETLAVAGTSFSSPYVAGLAALLLSVKPTLTPDQLESVVERTARDAGKRGRDPLYGWGVVQAGEAVGFLNSRRVIPPPEPDPPFPIGD